jgi:GT2 family glycosyltransferase
VVDNGSKDNTKEIIEDLVIAHGVCIKPIYIEHNMGTTFPRNLALKKAIGKYICIIDSDAYPKKGCFEQLLSRLTTNPKIGIVVPKLVYPNGHYQKSTDVFPTIFQKIFRLFFLKYMEAKQTIHGEGPVDYAISAFWLMKRELLKTVGYLDERIFYAPEDVDYCLRVWKTNYIIYYVTDATVIHDAQEISRGIKINRATLNHMRGLSYYFRKHKYLFKRPRYIGLEQK